jgi:thioredoxin
MKQIITFSFLLFTVLFTSCINSQSSKTNLAPSDFSKKIGETSEAFILDVRTPQEFSEGHIENAKNADWYGSSFDAQISKIDKSKPVFVYCLGGGRSSAAASHMRSEGFKEVYELDGGMMAWRSSGLSETTNTSTKTKAEGMTKDQFDKLITSDKIVIVDFFAVWCAPCKKMKPHLEEISKEMTDKVMVTKINVDENPVLAKELKIEGLPTLHFYKAGKLYSTKLGYLSKEDIILQLK